MDQAAKMKKLKDDTSFNKVNSFVTLQDKHREEANVSLREVVDAMIALMKNQDELFEDIYEKPLYVGSYWKGTRVGKPEEFDLDLVLKLPVDYAKIKFEGDRPGFAKIKLPADSLKPSWQKHKPLKQWLEDDYLNHDRFRRWFYGVLSKSFSQIPKYEKTWFTLTTSSNRQFKVKSRASGPAVTLEVLCNDSKFDIDFVPVLEFKTKPNLPVFKRVTGDSPWYLVPKPLTNGDRPNLSWRFSFYEHEKNLLKSRGQIKPIIRHLKKLKECQNWSSMLPSYYIETLVYHELQGPELNGNIEKRSNTSLLVHMLTQLKEACKKGEIPYYWDPRHNLLAEKTSDQLKNVYGRMEKILKEIEKDTKELLNYFLSAEERAQLSIESSSPSSPQSEQPSDDSGVFSPPPTCDLFAFDEDFLIDISEPMQPVKNVESMDQISILTRTVAVLADDMKTFQSTITNEVKELKSTIESLAQQTLMMQDMLRLLMEKELGLVNLSQLN